MPEKHTYKAWHAGNGGPISERHNAVDGLFRPNPVGRGLFSRISALVVTHLAMLNHTPRALNYTKTAVGTAPIMLETASKPL